MYMMQNIYCFRPQHRCNILIISCVIIYQIIPSGPWLHLNLKINNLYAQVRPNSENSAAARDPSMLPRPRTNDSETPRELGKSRLDLDGTTFEESGLVLASFTDLNSSQSTPGVDSPGLAVDTPNTNLKVRLFDNQICLFVCKPDCLLVLYTASHFKPFLQMSTASPIVGNLDRYGSLRTSIWARRSGFPVSSPFARLKQLINPRSAVAI